MTTKAINLTTNCLQIESAVRDVPAACADFGGLLGAAPIEQELVRRISGVVLDIDHRGCGDAVFQFCSPLTENIFTAEELRRVGGPCVTNLTFFVDDAPAARDILEGAGATTRLAWRTASGSWLRFLGEGNAKPDDALAEGFYMGTRHLFGFDFEFSEAPWIDAAKQRYMYPAFTYPRPQIDDKVRRLARLRVLVDDLDHYLGNIERLFSAEDRTDAYGHDSGPEARSARVALRGLELEYVQPHRGGQLYDDLLRRGPGITTAVFAVDDLASWPQATFPRRDVLGFDIELTAVEPAFGARPAPAPSAHGNEGAPHGA
ncbi:hypothetical protein [Yinghuangia sp. YIM S09857]|uniref:hypothetical protein n=1 Tax=Yinghuangia sp. YIM S09857 TaxID=3436929 RepID=UPI003F52DE8E